MTTSKKLRFIFASVLPEVVTTNTVYFLNNESNKSIVVIGDDVANRITFNSVENIEKYLQNGFVAAGNTAEEARLVIEAAAANHTHETATTTTSGLMSAQDKIKLDSIIELSSDDVKDANSQKIGLVSGKKLKDAFKEFLQRNAMGVLENPYKNVEFEIGYVYTGLTKPSEGTWIETDQVYLKSSFPDLSDALGSKPLGIPSYLPGNITNDTTPNNNSIVFAFEKWWMTSAGKVYSSTDGVTFTLVSAVTGGIFKDLFLFKGKLFVPSTNSNYYRVTSDGTTWESSTFSPYTSGFNPRAKVIDNILFVLGGSSRLIYTEDLVTWTVKSLPFSTATETTHIEKTNGVYFIFRNTNSGSGACYSQDLNTWAFISTAAKVDNVPVYFNGYYFILSSASNRYCRSSDLINWTTIASPTGLTTLTNVRLYVYKSYLLWLQNGSVIKATSDGLTWTNIAGSTKTVNFASDLDNSWFLTEDKTNLYVLTQDGFMYTSDGFNWKQHISSFYTSASPTFIGYLGDFLFLRINNRIVGTSDSFNWYDILPVGSTGYPVFYNGEEFLTVGTNVVTNKISVCSYDTATQFYVPSLKYPEAGVYKQWIKAL